MKILPWNEDSFFSKNGNVIVYDKAEHVIREFALIAFNIILLKVNMLCWVIIVEVFGIGWEVKDGFFPYGTVRNNPDQLIEGFSFKDLIANQVGILAGVAICL